MKQTAEEWLKVQIGNFPTIENLMTNIDKLVLEFLERYEHEKIN